MPQRSARPVASTADKAACAAMIETGSRSFHAASRLLPVAMRKGAYALYAFCRIADDLVDSEGGGAEAISALEARLAAVYRGAPQDEPVDRALCDAVRAFAIPRTLFEALLEGMAWDVEGKRYETLSEVTAYAARVAGTVGAMMAALFGARAFAMVARACDLGVAMQLTNIARDVGEDARNGRLYLPRAWLRQEGIDPEAFLAAPAFSPALGRVIARLLDAAEALYRRADAGIARLPWRVRPAIFAARHLYAAIGHRLGADLGFDSVSQRSVVPALDKARLVGLGLARSMRFAPAPSGPALPETHFLVEAVAAARAPAAGRPLDDDVAWVIDLFIRLNVRDRAAATQR
jgi:phytoene synthase